MEKEHLDHFNSTKRIIQDTLVKSLVDRIDTHKEFIRKCYSEIIKLNFKELEKPEGLKKGHLYKANLLEITNHLNSVGLKEYSSEFKSFETAIDEFLNATTESIILPQKDERFTIQSDDGLRVKLLKPFKKLFFSISKWPEKISNAVRKIRGKELTELKPWYHKIKYRDLSSYYLKEKLLFDLKPVVDQYYENVTISTLTFWRFDEQVDVQLTKHIGESNEQQTESVSKELIEEELQKLETCKQKIQSLIDDTFEKCCNEFIDTYYKVGTIECSNSRFSVRKGNLLHKKFENNFKKINGKWHNTLLVLRDDWQIDLELYDIIYDSLYQFEQIKTSIRSKLNNVGSARLKPIKDYLEEWKERIANAKPTELKGIIEKDLVPVSKELNKMLDESCKYIIDQEFLETIDTIELTTISSLDEVSQRRAVTKGVDFNSPVNNNQINYISPAELIQFETVPQFQKVAETAKLITNESLSEAESILLQIEQILTFNLETVLVKVDENGDLEAAQSIALEGIDRTIEQLAKVREILSKLENKALDHLRDGLINYSKNLIKFTNNENILELRMRIAKGKAIEKGRRIKAQVINAVRNFIPLAVQFIKKNYNEYSTLIKIKLKRLGIRGVKSTITTELADFLAETEEVIDRLPVVYQRLFRARPLEDDKFFEGRLEEHNQLSNSFRQWQNGRFAATIVVGEKGSGITTLLNQFLNHLNEPLETIRIAPENNICKEHDLLKFLNEAISKHDELEFDHIVNYLNTGRKKIVVIENLQNLFMKRIGGFSIVKVMAELISLTHKNTFWVAGCTLYAFNYLDKTINFSENFSYTVKMGELSTEDIVNIIERRHKVSGYSLTFEPNPDEANNKRFTNMTLEEQQSYLKKNYFSELNKLTKSNIRIALIYWLRSTVKGDGNQIIIKALGNVDYSFMNSLSNSKLEVLTLLLLHDGLTDEHVSEITLQSIQKTRGILHTLLEDGIVVRPLNTYFINPLLYRQTVSLLKAKNILH